MRSGPTLKPALSKATEVPTAMPATDPASRGIENLRATAESRIDSVLAVCPKDYALSISSLVAQMPTASSVGKSYNAVYACLLGKVSPEKIAQMLDFHFLGLEHVSGSELKKQISKPDSALTLYLAASAIGRMEHRNAAGFAKDNALFMRLTLPHNEAAIARLAKRELVYLLKSREDKISGSPLLVVLAPATELTSKAPVESKIALRRIKEIVGIVRREAPEIQIRFFEPEGSMGLDPIRDLQIDDLQRVAGQAKATMMLTDRRLYGYSEQLAVACGPNRWKAEIKNLCLVQDDTQRSSYEQRGVGAWVPKADEGSTVAETVANRVMEALIPHAKN